MEIWAVVVSFFAAVGGDDMASMDCSSLVYHALTPK